MRKSHFNRILCEVRRIGLLRNVFRPKHSYSLQVSRLVEIAFRNYGEKRLAGADFIDVAYAFNTIWVEGLLLELMVLNFLSYLV